VESDVSFVARLTAGNQVGAVVGGSDGLETERAVQDAYLEGRVSDGCR
jgi:hypothetical protein